MATFKVKIPTPDGEDFELDAKTCDDCKGIGYLAEPARFWIRAPEDTVAHLHSAGSGDRCPSCRGRGWVGLAGGKR